MGGLGEEESYEGGPRVSISKGWEGWARRRAMKVDLGYIRGGIEEESYEGGPRVRGGRVGRGGEL